MPVSARYQGYCSVCNQSIEVGDPIVSAFGSGWMHAEHTPEDAAASITMKRQTVGTKFTPKKMRTPRSCVVCSTRTAIKQVRRRDGTWVWACDHHRSSASFD